jgi:hypothetical protein
MTTPTTNSAATNLTAIGLLVVSLLWAGMLLGVSFLATPAKFLAPSLALPVALDVGRHTFAVFNGVEIGWSAALVGLTLFRLPARWLYGMVAISCGIVALETAWLLPVLDARVGMIIAGSTPPESSLHLLYILLEAVKLAALLALAFGSLRHLVRTARRPAAAHRARAGAFEHPAAALSE